MTLAPTWQCFYDSSGSLVCPGVRARFLQPIPSHRGAGTFHGCLHTFACRAVGPTSADLLTFPTARFMATRLVLCALAFWNFWTLLPSPRWNVSRLIAYFCMQGGGVRVDGSANFERCNLYQNEASYVRARIRILWTLLPAPRCNTDTLRCLDTQGVGART